jgi:HlyD family secretion protein
LAQVFRQKALERLNSPDQLDTLVTVTSPTGWLALGMVGAMLLAVVVWSVVGSLPTRVSGNGILLNKGGMVIEARVSMNGILSEVAVAVGDGVQQGQLVARLTLPDAEQRRRGAQELLSERQAEFERLQRYGVEEIELKKQSLERQRRTLEVQIELGREQQRFLRKKLDDDEGLFGRRIISRQQLEQTRGEYTQASRQIADLMNMLLTLQSQEFDMIGGAEQRLKTAEFAVSEAKRQLAELESRLIDDSSVEAPVTGRVTEIQAAAGSVVLQGTPVLSVERGGVGLKLLLYIPPEHGKKVQAGMEALVSPVTAKREEFGSIVGIVRSVSDFPATFEGTRSVLQNEELTRTFFGTGPPYMVEVELIDDASTASGYRWTSDRAQSLTLSSGTLSTAEITVRRQRPIVLVIPLIRSIGGM